MLVLAVDTSARTGSLAVLRDGSIISVAAIPRDAGFSSSLFSQLAAILTETGFSLPEFDLFAVCAGPGSFTGLRVGLTAVKAWSEVYQRPIAAVSGLQAIAARSPGRTRLIAPFFDAGRGQVFGGLYSHREDRLECVADEMVLPPQDFLTFISTKALHPSDVTFVSTTPLALDQARRESVFEGNRVQAVSELLADSIGTLGYQQALRNEVVDAYALDANYVRRSDAEFFWKDQASKLTRA
jgi:tRNA threonylcarbamoyladenosine biosynthesis protein TsaB